VTASCVQIEPNAVPLVNQSVSRPQIADGFD